MKTLWNLYVKYFEIINFPLCIMAIFMAKRMQLYKDDASFVDIIAGIYWTIYFYCICPPKIKYYEYLALPAFAYILTYYVRHWDRIVEMLQAMGRSFF